VKTFQPTHRLKLDGDNASLARKIATGGYGPTPLITVFDRCCFTPITASIAANTGHISVSIHRQRRCEGGNHEAIHRRRTRCRTDAGGLITSAPPASAGCQYGGLVTKKCDGHIQDDGTWQRCVTTQVPSFDRSYPGFYRQTSCQMTGPDQNPLGFAYFDPLTHIDD
jgi:hypothetical protein